MWTCLRVFFVFLISIIFIFNRSIILAEVNLIDETIVPIDKNGYVIFCLCMGRFGNQADQFLGAMSFAKKLNRTLVVPPFHTYKNIPFNEWFRLDKLSEFHRVIAAEQFMSSVAPVIWPEPNRTGFCWRPPTQVAHSAIYNSQDTTCRMKDGYPMSNFWSELGIEEFPKSVMFDIDLSELEKWKNLYGAEKYPVLALRGAPGAFPVRKENWKNQKYMVWSDKIITEAEEIIKNEFGGVESKFLGIHLRNGDDWLNACKHSDGMNAYMASPQCLDPNDVSRSGTSKQRSQLTKEMCFPAKQTILLDLEHLLVNVLNKTVRNVYIATDKDPMLNDIRKHFKGIIDDLKLVHRDPWLPLIDLAVLGKSDHFIGNCVSSFTSFVKRERDLSHKSTYFWAFFRS